MRLMFYLTFCFLQILFIAHAMEEDNDFEPLLSIRSPYSVKKDEIINVAAVVYNYYHKDLDVNVTLDNSDGEYDIINSDYEVINEPTSTKTKHVKKHETVTFSFLIRPKVLGIAILKFNTSSLAYCDIVHKKINVASEGIAQYESHAISVDLKNESQQKYQIKVDLPEGLTPDSLHADVGVLGDILDFVLNNLDNLVRTATVCGEQTLSSLFPSYLVIKKLMNSNSETQTVRDNLCDCLKYGYKKILNYRQPDGSLSNFGTSEDEENPRNGSTWLTAAFLRFLPQIKDYVDVNETIVEEGLAYLSKQQARNGAFAERSDYFLDSQRDPITVTVAAVLAFLRHPKYGDIYSQEITKGLNFIAKNLEKYKSLHAHLIAVYAAKKDRQVLTKEMNLMEWLSTTRLTNQTEWWHYEFLNDIEVTSYNFITSLKLNSSKVNFIVPVAKWRIASHFALGRFANTQDTTTGLINLITSAQRANNQLLNMDINFVTKARNETIKLTEYDAHLYKRLKFPKTDSFSISANGTGSALMQFSFQYNFIQKDYEPHFIINLYKRSDGPSYLEMYVCVKYIGKDISSNMTLLEISTPTGFVIKKEILRDINIFERVTYTDLKNEDSLLVIYFDHLFKNEEVCLLVKAFKTYSVDMQKTASIIIYDYYATTGKAAAFYNI